jgi:hypothetical protein
MDQEPTVTIRIPSSVEERRVLGEVYRAVAEVFLRTADATDGVGFDEDDDVLGPVPKAASAYVGESLVENVDWFLREVTQNARLLIRAIAEKAAVGDVATSDEVRTRLKVRNDGTLGGFAASIGFATKRTRLPKPYERTSEYGREGWEPVYRMDQEVAKTVLRLVDEEGNVRDD